MVNENVAFTKDEIQRGICYLAKDVKMDSVLASNVNILGGFYQRFKTAILIEDSVTKELIATFTIAVDPADLSDWQLENQVVINHDIVGRIESDYKKVVEELTDQNLVPVKYNFAESFMITLKDEHSERMVDFIDCLKIEQKRRLLDQ